ncbi:MAG: hypothetical protein FWC41_02400 [Firmicutes bacterium]|nr:hypothetical protein [Bacillota bacterium]
MNSTTTINNNPIFHLLDLYFDSRKLEFEISQITDAKLLIEKNILSKVNNKRVSINVNSIDLQEVFLEYAENKLARKIPQNIEDAFAFINDFDEFIRKEHQSNITNAYSSMIDALKQYILYLFHSKEIANIFDFLRSLPEKKIHRYGRYILQTIFQIEISVEEIYNLFSFIKVQKSNMYLFDFCFQLGKLKPILANQMIEHILQKNIEDDNNFLANILKGLYEVEKEQTFLKIKDLTKTNPQLAYYTLSKLNYTNTKHISDCFIMAEKAKNNNDFLFLTTHIFNSLIENKFTPKEIRKKCFSYLEEMFSIENEQLRENIFFYLQAIEGYEKERYKILSKTILTKSNKYLSRINDFFCNFSNPFYFFELFVSVCYALRKHNKMVDAIIFSESLSRFWRVDRNSTEQHLLNLLSYEIPCVRAGTVHLIACNRSDIYEVNLLTLDTEQKQLRVLEALFFYCFIDIDKFLPLLLSLHQSPYPNVVQYLQVNLSKLTVEAYPNYLHEKIAKQISDDAFLKPLKEDMGLYKKMQKAKESINDLNPSKNELEWMNLFYKLEREVQEKMMRKEKTKKNTIMSLFKTSIIVRGNSWKVGDNEVSPLALIQHSIPMDMRMYKNPDLFDHTFNIFNSQF